MAKKSGKQTKRAELLRALSNQVRALFLNATKRSQIDQAIVEEMQFASRAICKLEEKATSDHPRNQRVDKEGRELRSLLNQIEERIQILAKQYADDVVIQKNRGTKSGESPNRWTADAPISPKATAAK